MRPPYIFCAFGTGRSLLRGRIGRLEGGEARSIVLHSRRVRFLFRG